MAVKSLPVTHWDDNFYTPNQTELNEIMMALEQGAILFLPKLSFELLAHESIFLTEGFASLKAKNISFNLKTGLLRGIKQPDDALKIMLERYAKACLALVKKLLPHYEDSLEIGRTSFRPIEIQGRIPKSYRKDDTRLHVDAFPSTPTQGKRLLRVFCNINPRMPRLWHMGEPFEQVATKFLPHTKPSWPFRAALLKLLGITRTKSTEYDYLMLQIHNQMKKDVTYQSTVSKTELAFEPGTTWIVQTDHVSHAALKGQHLLEQTFYLPYDAMQNPANSPLKILEKLSARKLI